MGAIPIAKRTTAAAAAATTSSSSNSSSSSSSSSSSGDGGNGDAGSAGEGATSVGEHEEADRGVAELLHSWGFPVALVDDWGDISERRLKEWAADFADAAMDDALLERLTNSYWLRACCERSGL